MNKKKEFQLKAFIAAKQIALTIGKGQMRRAKINNKPVNYSGANINGRMFVIADNLNNLQNPDAYINNKPAREIFDDFTYIHR